MDLFNILKHIFEKAIPREEKSQEFLQVIPKIKIYERITAVPEPEGEMAFTLVLGNGKISITPDKIPDYQAEYVAPLKSYLDFLQGKLSPLDLKSNLKIKQKIGGVNIDKVLDILEDSAQQNNEIQNLLSLYREKYKI
ncbi:MAG: hypothetical protein KIH08_07840 [Candidatus Freyarchaeota archaeon]|nr:hypothetical protein [Candidatus Jordarchaeia archaeon]MBS7270235.1 hypothetical protein [Candidatus Jordarchaeia archaeon]MBS7280966.1 hypothetical protein [Candidatus Jordarchaeia archaeon]